MKNKIKFIDLNYDILASFKDDADNVRKICKKNHIFLWNVMASPGSGKTTLILDIIKKLSSKYKIAIIEADLASSCDSELIIQNGVPCVQLNTGNSGCHVEANMVLEAFKLLNLDDLDIVIVENIGNLVCPAEFDIGSNFNMMILSVPEGDDKALKYPLMFKTSDCLVVTKTDVLPYFDFNLDRLLINVNKINKEIKIIPLSVKTNENLNDFYSYINDLLKSYF